MVDRGDVVWLEFNPQAGHEQAGRRPALTVSPAVYNRRAGLALFCPITSKVKGHPFEVLLPEGLSVKGAILSDQVKSLDWKARNARFLCVIHEGVMDEVLAKLGTLTGR